jgi:hypothetical protein
MNQQEIDKRLDEIIDKAESDLDVVFAKRLKAIMENVLRIYSTYMKGGELTRTDFYKSTRYKAEMKHIAEQLDREYRKVYEDTQKLLEEQYIDNYLMTGFLLGYFAMEEDEQPQPFAYTIPAAETINQAILNPIKELTLPILLNNHRNETIRKINIEIAQGLQAGEGYSDIAERLQKVLGFSATKAKRVARTEAGRVQSISRMKSAEHAEKVLNGSVEMSVKEIAEEVIEPTVTDQTPEKKPSEPATSDKSNEEPEQQESDKRLTKGWNSALDMDVRSSHRVLDDQAADSEGYFHHKGAKAKGPHLWGIASMDINCRCALIYLVDGQKPELRRARDYQDIDYLKKLVKRIDKYTEQGMTEKQAEKKAMKEVKPPSIVIEYKSFNEWKKGLKRA